jgi:dTDP-glucose 4,6-dehydratase
MASALVFLLIKQDWKFEKVNIVGEMEVDNLALAQFIAKVVGEPLRYGMVDFHSSRPGHDLRYALNGDKLKRMGWEQPKTFYESLEKTIRWTLNRPDWLGMENK